MSFAAPFALVALVLVPGVLAYAVWVDRRRARYAVAFTNLEVLAAVAREPRFPWRRWLPVVLLLASLAAAATALARPRERAWVPEDNAAVVLLVDTSGSMRARDVEPTRLDAATAAMRLFLDKLPGRLKVGLVEFSSVPNVLAEPTADRQVVRDAIDYLSPDSGTAIGDGLDIATRLLVATLAGEGVKRGADGLLPGAIVLLSDGAQNRGRLEPLEAARKARASGVRVYTIALGTRRGVVRFGFGQFGETVPVPPDPVTMRAIARSTGAKSFTARSVGRVEAAYKELGSSIGRRRELREITSWFAAAAAALLVSALGVSRAFAPRLP